MIGEWLQLAARVALALFVFIGVALLLADLDGQTLRYYRRYRRYRDVARDHTEHGDEDPPRYRGGGPPEHLCRFCGSLVVPARDGMRCARCCALHTTGLPHEEAIRTSAADIEAHWKALESEQRAREALRAGYQGIAPQAPKIARRRDGIRLGDEASAALWQDVMGTDEPPRG